MRRHAFAMLIALTHPAVSADVLLRESFSGYSINAPLDGQNGGVGFKSEWSGSSDGPEIASSSFGYTDAGGNSFLTEGNAVRGMSSRDSLNRDTADSLFNMKTDVWASFALTGSAGGISNVSFADELILGQGSNENSSANWSIFDKNGGGFIFSTVAAEGDALFVARLTRDGGSDGNITNVLAWINPLLSTAPDAATAFNTGGTAVSGPKLSTITLNLQNGDDDVFIHDVRFGDSFFDVAPFEMGTPVPEPATVIVMGLGLTVCAAVEWRRRRRTAA